MLTKWSSILTELTQLYTMKWITHEGKKFRAVYAIDLIDYFITQYHIYNKVTIQLNSRWLKLIYGNQYPTIIDWLLVNDIIYLYKNYSTGKSSKQYKLTKKVVVAGFVSTKVKSCPRMEGKKTQHLAKKDAVNASGISEEVISHLRWSLSLIKLDYNGAKHILNDLQLEPTALRINMQHIDKIAAGEIKAGFDTHGRFHTNYTRLKRQVRHSSLSINGSALKELDITNSQPFFLLLIMKSMGFYDERYFDDVIKGRIYDNISMFCEEDRPTVKTEVFRILFGRNRITKLGCVEETFKTLYPATMEWIIAYKKTLGTHKKLAHMLQRTESDFIFKTAIPEIIEWKRIPMLTIHDSIVFEDEHYDEIKKIWVSCLTKVLAK